MIRSVDAALELLKLRLARRPLADLLLEQVDQRRQPRLGVANELDRRRDIAVDLLGVDVDADDLRGRVEGRGLAEVVEEARADDERDVRLRPQLQLRRPGSGRGSAGRRSRPCRSRS